MILPLLFDNAYDTTADLAGVALAIEWAEW